MTESQESLCIQMLQKIAKFESFIDAPTTMASTNTKKQAAEAFLRNAPTRAMRREKPSVLDRPAAHCLRHRQPHQDHEFRVAGQDYHQGKMYQALTK